MVTNGTKPAESETAETIHNAGKVQLADHARLMADNQRILNAANRADRRARDLEARIEEAQASKAFPGISPPDKSAIEESEPVKILIDSPTTTHYHTAPKEPAGQQTTPDSKPAGTLAKAALAAALLGTGAGGGLAIPWLAGMFDKPPAVEHPPDSLQQIVVE